MRLHQLSATAFGPFVDTVDVDFDALSDAGLFLLSGATGAGKSSVLDAVCFALYGAVPGDRQQAGRLRSDQAPPSLAPSVSLDLTIAARRFCVVRSPAWRRPKKRGEGTTTEQARVSLSERVDGAWVHLTSRLDEAGDLLSGLLGMNLDQFCQVALLPQGQVQAFLRARPDERQRLLARLFRTGRFERVEAWLREHRLALRRASEEHAATVLALVSRLSEAGGQAPVEESPTAQSPVDELASWSRELRVRVLARRTAGEAAAAAALRVLHDAEQALEATRAAADARARVRRAAEQAEALDRAADEHADDVRRLEQARRADGTRPLARLVAERAEALDSVVGREEGARARAAEAGLEVAHLDSADQRLAVEQASLMALVPVEQQLSALHRRSAEQVAETTACEQEQELADAERAALASLTAELVTRTAVASEAVVALPASEAEVERLRAAARAHEELAGVSVEHAAAHADHLVARSLVGDLREHLLDLRERRIAGMAAELAGALVVGADCPVCGSAEHPRPAGPSAAQPDGNDEHAAQRALDDAQAVELALALKVRDLEGALARLRAIVGDSDAAETRSRLAAAEDGLARLRAEAEAHDGLRRQVADAGQRAADLEAAATRRALRLAELAVVGEHLRAQTDALERRVAEARGEHPELEQALAALTARRDLVREVAAVLREAEGARSAYDNAVTAAEHAALEAGFGSAAEAADAGLPADVVSALDRRVHEHRSALAAARAVLDEPDAWELLTSPDPDLPTREAAARAAADAHAAAQAAAAHAERTDERVRGLADQLDAALASWRPLRDELDLATRVSSFAEGKAPDNRLQMRLSAYVLAYRLSQVVAAANARLGTMSDRRYTLEHVPARGARESRGGLSLVVRDDWSGDSRDPATLSGGETFVVSLALALGLADVVAHEAGGVDLQTLFVDEGFGALDSETLDDVLDILDGLRENGRAVGVVSHVAEMRDRIPTQLLVRKSRAGSTLQVVAG